MSIGTAGAVLRGAIRCGVRGGRASSKGAAGVLERGYPQRRMHSASAAKPPPQGTGRPDHMDLTAGEFRHPGEKWATIAEVKQLTGTVRELTLEVEEGRDALPFAPGQWVDFIIPGVPTVGGYSITSPPSMLPRISLAVKASGHPPARWCSTDAKPGDRVLLRTGGSFTLGRAPASAEGLIFVAGGIGINPLYAMLQQWRERCIVIEKMRAEGAGPRTSPPRIALLYSASVASELAFAQNLLDLQAATPETFKVTFLESRQALPGGSAAGVGALADPAATDVGKGRVGPEQLQDALAWLGSKPETTHMFVCGPPGMPETMTKHAHGLGMHPRQVHFERWW